MSNCFLFLKKKRADHNSRLFVKKLLLHHHRLLAAVAEGEHKPSVIVNGDVLDGVSRKTADRLGKCGAKRSESPQKEKIAALQTKGVAAE